VEEGKRRRMRKKRGGRSISRRDMLGGRSC
jgi:hypothetical protein